jgi:hypothetical protein
MKLATFLSFNRNQNYFAGGDYEPSILGKNSSTKTRSSKLLKRWHCRTRSTYRCLKLISTELSKSLYLRKNDLALIDAWIMDLTSIHYAEPPMLPRRRSHTNPCLGADGLHGVSFFPALEPNNEFLAEDFISKRNDTLKSIVSQSYMKEEDILRDKRDALEARTTTEDGEGLESDLTPPEENSTYYPIDWSSYASQVTDNPLAASSFEDETSSGMNLGSRGRSSSSAAARDSYYSQLREAMKEVDDSSSSDFDSISNPSEVYSQRVLPYVVDKPAGASYAAMLNDPRAAYLTAARSAKQLLQRIPSKSSEIVPEEFPILKTMAESMCPGFGPLIPYQPKTVHDDTLLIVVFTNQHYDLIPTLEVLYRSSFPNMLYCGHPHVSVDLFLRKYQTVEHRSFSFLPTYTKASYECVLGAMEMNYEVKGYAVITDETLMKSWNIENLDKNKIWVSNSLHDTRHVPVTRNSWSKLDPRGQKLPRLLDGIINTWKLFSYILVGQENLLLEPKTIKKRSLDSNPGQSQTYRAESEDGEVLEAAAASYIPVQSSEPLWPSEPVEKKNDTNSSGTGENKNSLQTEPETKWDGDLSVSDWDNLKEFTGLVEEDLKNNEENKTNSTNLSAITTEVETEDVEVGDDDDETSSPGGVQDWLSTERAISSTSAPLEMDGSSTTDESDSVILATPTPDTISEDNLTSSVWPLDRDTGSVEAGTTSSPDSSVGVPLYHVEHTEPPTPSTWHKPDDIHSTTEDSLIQGQNKTESSISSSSSPSPAGSSDANAQDPQEVDSSPVTKVPSGEIFQGQSSSSGFGSESETVSTTGAPNNNAKQSSSSSEAPQKGASGSSVPSSSTSSDIHVKDKSAQVFDDTELRKEMDLLLDTLQVIYLNMRAVVAEYKDSNETKTGSHEGGSAEGETLEK